MLSREVCAGNEGSAHTPYTLQHGIPGCELGDPRDLQFNLLLSSCFVFPGHVTTQSLVTCLQVRKSHWFHYQMPSEKFSNMK